MRRQMYCQETIQTNEIVSIWNSQVPNLSDFPINDFLHIGFTHHRIILGKVKGLDNNQIVLYNNKFTQIIYLRKLIVIL